MPADRISRTRSIDGVVTPAVIHNSSYFFVNLQVFADGSISCWELVDLARFEEKLRSGWVVPGVPDGKAISVYGLGEWTVADGRWTLDAKALYQRVRNLVEEMNPRMEDLFVWRESTAKRGKPRPVPWIQDAGTFASDEPVRLVGDGWFPKRLRGSHSSVFVHDRDYHLADLRVFADGAVELGRLAAPETLDLEGLRRAVDEKRLVTSVPAGGRVQIQNLGTFVAKEAGWHIDVHEMLLEVHDRIEILNGRPDSIVRCRKAYQAYVDDPREAGVAALRAAYEAIPEHNRMYVGDMDTKDVAVRMIVYGEQEIESWSHRIVARAEGLPLPTITVPKPKKD